MKLKYIMLRWALVFFLFTGCTSSSQEEDIPEKEIESSLKIIALGDSYTIGESVCETCRFPEQLKDSLIVNTENADIGLKVIARTGWTTGILKAAINQENPENDYDLATLLIGVNNQFQGIPFGEFEVEFPELVNTAISLAKGIKKNLVVVSIPDYAYTPSGGGRTTISQEIDIYNNYIEAYCKANFITYVYITDITRQGIEKPDLVANDGLHPSTLAYSKFVTRILPFALEKISDN